MKDYNLLGNNCQAFALAVYKKITKQVAQFVEEQDSSPVSSFSALDQEVAADDVDHIETVHERQRAQIYDFDTVGI